MWNLHAQQLWAAVLLTRLDQVLHPSEATMLPLGASLLTADGASEPVKLELEPTTGSSVYGQTNYFSFSTTVRQGVAYTTLETIQGGDTSSRASFQLQSDVFVVPSMTTVRGPMINFTVAARMAGGDRVSSQVQVSISAPMRQQGTLAPKIARYDNADVKLVPPSAVTHAYQLWEGSLDLGAPVTGAIAVTATGASSTGAGGDVVRDVLYLSGGAAGW
jgi:hypothetical protein